MCKFVFCGIKLILFQKNHETKKTLQQKINRNYSIKNLDKTNSSSLNNIIFLNKKK